MLVYADNFFLPRFSNQCVDVSKEIKKVGVLGGCLGVSPPQNPEVDTYSETNCKDRKILPIGWRLHISVFIFESLCANKNWGIWGKSVQAVKSQIRDICVLIVIVLWRNRENWKKFFFPETVTKSNYFWFGFFFLKKKGGMFLTTEYSHSLLIVKLWKYNTIHWF